MPFFPLIEPTELTSVTLRPGVPVRLRVVDAKGRPVAGAAVAVRGWIGDRSRARDQGLWLPVGLRTATTGEDGTVVVPCRERERLRVDAVSGSRSGVVLPVSPIAARGETVTVALEDGPVGRLEVVDADGHPVARAVVWGEGSLPVALTDDTGRAEVTLRGGGAVAVQVDAANGDGGHGVLGPAPEDDASPAPVRLRVAPPETLVARIVDAESRAPVAGA